MLYLRNPEGVMTVSSISTKRQVSCSERDIPRVVFSLEAWRDMGLVIEIGFGPNQVSWFACVTRTDTPQGTVYHVDRIHIPKQVNTPVTTKVSPVGCHHALGMTEGEYGKATRFFWGQSRVDGITTPSSIDEATAERWDVYSAHNVLVGIMGDAPETENISEILEEYTREAVLIRAIGNKAGDLRIDVFDFEKKLRFDRLPWELEGVRESRERLSEIIQQQCAVAGA